MKKGLVVFGIIIFSILFCRHANCQSWQELLDEADSLSKAANYDSAIVIGTLALEMVEEQLGSEDIATARVLHGLGSYNLANANYDKAESLLSRALNIREKELDPENPELGKTMNNLANVYYQFRKYEEAKLLYQRVLSITEKTKGPEHKDMARILNTIANICLYQAKFDEAEPLYRQSLTIRESVYGPDHLEVANSLINLAMLYNRQARYVEAEPLIIQSLAITEKAVGPEHSNVAVRLNSLGLLYMHQGKYKAADSILTKSLAITVKALGMEHHQVARSLANLGNLYWQQGKYNEAEQAHTRSLAILEKAHGVEHPNVAICLNNMANLYRDLGRQTQAELLFQRSLTIWETTLGPQHPYVAISLHNLANLYTSLGRYEEAGPIFERALKITESALGPDHPDMAKSLNNLGGHYLNLNKYAEAEQCFRRSLDIFEKVNGPDHPFVAASLINLADIYVALHDYVKVDQIYARSLLIRKNILGQTHPDVASSITGLANSSRNQGMFGEAINHAEDAYTIRWNDLLNNGLVLSEKDAIAYSQFLRKSFNEFLTLYYELGDTAVAFAERASNIAFSSKGQVSDGIYERQRAIVKETDSTTLALAEELRLNKFLRANLFVQGPGEDVDEYRGKVDSLDELVNELEGDLARHSASYRKYQDQKDISIERIASLLLDESALVEYLKYDYYQLKPDSTIPKYLAVVLTKDGNPTIIDLGDASEIDPIIDEYRVHMQDVAGKIPSPTDSDMKAYQIISQKLYEKVWQPIEEHIDNQQLVFIAPDGALNLVSFAGFINGDGKYLIEDHTIHYLSAGRDLIRLSDESNPGSGLFAIGDPNFDSTANMTTRQASAPEDTDSDIGYLTNITRNHLSNCPKFDELDQPRLAGTRTEVEMVIAQWRKSTNEPAVAYFDEEATEDRFKEEAPGKRTIHLATHGFYYEGDCRPDIPQRRMGEDVGYVGENPLLLSGLFFAGANRVGDSSVKNEGDDGILTAYEVSSMNLEETELVVLSACETGLGEVKDGEGVYGLRRAFQMAGARTVISALWRVSDQATSELLGKLYNEQGPSMPDRFRKIQLEKLKKLRQQGKVDHPISWAGFIASGDWR